MLEQAINADHVHVGALSDASMLASAQADKTTSRALQGCILMQGRLMRSVPGTVTVTVCTCCSVC